ncbi:MAG: xanthine phosphoribosyltransferase [Anaerolineae bacterium]
MIVDILKQRIREEGKNLGGGILKVDSFLNHQVDATLMMLVGKEIARRMGRLGANKVLTAEISGIAPAVMTAWALDVPVVYARKHKPITMPQEVYVQRAPSHTKGGGVELMVSPEFLGPGDRVLIVDDFLATGRTISALVGLVQQSGATLVGIGAVIEKRFEAGREELGDLGVPVEALVAIERMEGDDIVLADC